MEKLGQVIRDRYAVAVFKARDEIVGHLSRNISTMFSIFIRRGGISYCSFRETAIFKGSSTGWDGNSLGNLRDWRPIQENRESFPPRTICIIRYIIVQWVEKHISMCNIIGRPRNSLIVICKKYCI